MFFILCKVCHSDKTCGNSNIFSQELQQSLCLQLFPQGLSEWLRFDYLATLSLVPSLGMPYVIALPPGKNIITIRIPIIQIFYHICLARHYTRQSEKARQDPTIVLVFCIQETVWLPTSSCFTQ